MWMSSMKCTEINVRFHIWGMFINFIDFDRTVITTVRFSIHAPSETSCYLSVV